LSASLVWLAWVQESSSNEGMATDKQTVDLFDQTAGRFAQQIDALIRTGGYVRGRLFDDLAKKHCEPGGFILDYGCGPGRIAHLLACSGFTVLGVDSSTEMIRQAQLQSGAGPNMQFRTLGEGGAIFESDTYAGIVCSSVVEFVDDAGALLRSFFKALKPGGVVIISYANSSSVWRRYSSYHAGRHPHLNVQQHVWNWRQARNIFLDAGFEVASGPRAFESPFDKRGFLTYLSRLNFIGTLCLVVLRKPR
jgi:2-polyprenyl-3-methyl-5-hydroxy-6-metoxy-1,4-benzoquinol methylase